MDLFSRSLLIETEFFWYLWINALWFVRLLQRDKRFEVNNVSTFFDNVGTDKYKRVYAEVSRKKKDSGKKPSNVMQVEEKCHYIGSGMVIR
jgi:hypothetical protein